MENQLAPHCACVFITAFFLLNSTAHMTPRRTVRASKLGTEPDHARRADTQFAAMGNKSEWIRAKHSCFTYHHCTTCNGEAGRESRSLLDLTGRPAPVLGSEGRWSESNPSSSVRVLLHPSTKGPPQAAREAEDCSAAGQKVTIALRGFDYHFVGENIDRCTWGRRNYGYSDPGRVPLL